MRSSRDLEGRAARTLGCALLGAALAAGCGSGSLDGGDERPPEQCLLQRDYPPFDAAAMASGEGAAARYTELTAALEVAEIDPGNAAEAWATVEAAYASLEPLVQSVHDVRRAGRPAEGAALAQTISAAITAGKAATTSLAAAVEGETIKAALLRAFALAALEKTAEGSRPAFDTAFGYLGCKPDNDELERESVSHESTRLDQSEGTLWSESLFATARDAQCALAKGLSEAGVESLGGNLDAAPDYKAEHSRLARVLNAIFAQGAAVAARRVAEDDSAAALARLEGLFAFLAPVMQAETAFAADAQLIATEIAQAKSAMADFDKEPEIRAALDKVFSFTTTD